MKTVETNTMGEIFLHISQNRDAVYRGLRPGQSGVNRTCRGNMYIGYSSSNPYYVKHMSVCL